MGRFNLGSTVIMLLPEHPKLDESLQAGNKVSLGQAMANVSGFRVYNPKPKDADTSKFHVYTEDVDNEADDLLDDFLEELRLLINNSDTNVSPSRNLMTRTPCVARPCKLISEHGNRNTVPC